MNPSPSRPPQPAGAELSAASESNRPEILTERLRLRPFRLEDAPAVTELASDRAISLTTLNIPHPYTLEIAREWISAHEQAFAARALANFGLFTRASGQLVGTVGLVISPRHHRADLGYWIGVPFWGCGYATEGARAVIDFGFERLHLNRITAGYFTGNEASGAVMRKLGMTREGTQRQHVLKDDQFVDIESYALLRQEWEARRASK